LTFGFVDREVLLYAQQSLYKEGWKLDRNKT